MNFQDQIKDTFKKGSSLTKLIYINVGVFLIIKIAIAIAFLFDVQDPNGFSLIYFLALPADFSNIIVKPWTPITYMFLHEGLMHLFFNMLWLFWLGRIFLEYFDQKKLISVYLLGGISGGILYILSYNIFPVFKEGLELSYLLGASAAVLAIVIAISVYVPNYTIYFFFFRIKLIYIALFSVFLDIIRIPTSNSGGYIAHLGGAFFGFLYIQQFRKGKDMSVGINRIIDKLGLLFKPKKKIKVTHKRPKTDMEYNKAKKEQQKDIDKILDKISKSGYESLTKEEKETLFKMSNN